MTRSDARGGGAARHGRVHGAPARHDCAALPRRRPDATLGNAADRAAARPRRRRHDARQLRHLLPHAAARCSSCGGERFGLEELTPRGAGPVLPRASSASSTSRRSRPSWPAATPRSCKRGAEALGWSRRLPLPQRARLRRLGRVRLRLPDARQAARRHHLRAARVGAGAHDLSPAPARGGSCYERGRARGVEARPRGGGRAAGRAATRRSSPAARSTRRCCCAAQRPRRRVGRARAQPRAPPGDRAFARCSTRRSTWRSGVPQSLLRRRVRRRGDHVRGRRRPARLRRRCRCRSAGERHRELMLRLPPDLAVRADGVRQLARLACARAPGGR